MTEITIFFGVIVLAWISYSIGSGLYSDKKLPTIENGFDDE